MERLIGSSLALTGNLHVLTERNVLEEFIVLAVLLLNVKCEN